MLLTDSEVYSKVTEICGALLITDDYFVLHLSKPCCPISKPGQLTRDAVALWLACWTPGGLCCVLGQNALISQCFFPPGSINGYPKPEPVHWLVYYRFVYYSKEYLRQACEKLMGNRRIMMMTITHFYSAFSRKGSNALYNQSQGVRQDINL